MLGIHSNLVPGSAYANDHSNIIVNHLSEY